MVEFNMMKVAYINSVAGYGSTGHIVDALASMNEVEGKIYYGRKENSAKAKTMRFTGFLGNVKHAFDTYFFDAHGFSNTKETQNLINDLKDLKPDLIHLHNLHGYYLNVEILFQYLKESGIPVVWTLHDCWSFTGHCAHYEALGCEKWKTNCTNCPALNQYPVTWNGKNVSKNYQKKKEIFTSLPIEQLTLVTPSLWLKNQVEQSFLQAYPVEVIPTGIELERFKEVQTPKDSTDFNILAIASSWTKEKGLFDLQELSHQLRPHQKLTVIGLTKAQMKDFSKENTTLLERTNSLSELIQAYKNSDLFLNLTYQDTFPTVNIEALACGCPVLTYQSGGSAECLSENTGIIIPRGDLPKVVRTLEQIDRKEITFDKEACILQANNYSKEKMLDTYLALYESKVK